MIVMGSEMDPAALQEAAKAHVKAIDRMDDKGVLKEDDFEAILAGLGKAISSVSAGKVMDVYNEMSKLTGPSSGEVLKYVYAKQNSGNAVAAYTALMQFKDVVASAQPKPSAEYSGFDFGQIGFALLGLGLLAGLGH